MRRQSHRRNLVVRGSRADPPGWSCAPARLGRAGRVRRLIRTGALLAIIGLMHLARAAHPHWRPVLLLAGGVLALAGVLLASGVLFLPGMLVFLSALLVPSDPSTAFVYCIGGPAQLVRNAGLGGHPDRAGRQ
jgi:hypothetical protein